MRKILILFLSIIAYANEFANTLTETKHQEIYKQYYSNIIKNIDHNSKFATQYKIKFCKMGLAEACGDVGVEYILGFSLPKNDVKALKYLEFAAKNSRLDTQKQAYKIALEIASALNGKSGVKMRNYIKEIAWSSSDQCLQKGDQCALSLAYFYLLPYFDFGFETQKDMTAHLQKIYKNDKSGFLLNLTAEILLYTGIFNISF